MLNNIKADIKRLGTIQKKILTDIEHIKKNNKALSKDDFSVIINTSKNITSQSEIALEIKKEAYAASDEKNPETQIKILTIVNELINGEVTRLSNQLENEKQNHTNTKGKIHNGVYASILAVSVVPAIITIQKGLNGMVVTDINGSTGSQGIITGVYFTIAIILLIIASMYTIVLFMNRKKSKDNNTRDNLSISHKKTFKEKLHKSILSKTRILDINENTAEKYLVYMVGAVGLVAIIILLI